LQALILTTRLEGITPALETAHAVAFVIKKRKQFSTRDSIIICFSGRGDKDMDIVRRAEAGERFE
jgi:tryptophan synthase beta chain